jgi:cysteine desulfurase/selenocysteine lyase
MVADFINAKSEEIVFTKNTTESLNLLAYTLLGLWKKGKNEIVLTEMEHHSNLVPWQQFAKEHHMRLRIIKVKDDFTLDMEDAKQKINEKTGLVAFTHVSNVLGTINPIEELIKLAKEKKAFTVVDAAQSISNIKIDVDKLDCDFLVFSSHKMLGPTGVGVLYGKKELLEELPPFNFGGGMIKTVRWGDAEWAKSPEKFEAGTQNIGEAIGLAEAISYLNEIGVENIGDWEKELTKYALEKLREVPGIKIYNPGADKSAGIISFSMGKIHPHDVSGILNEKAIAVRAGHCCAMPLVKKLGIPEGVSRISFSIYNTFEEIDELVKALKEVNRKLGEDA